MGGVNRRGLLALLGGAAAAPAVGAKAAAQALGVDLALVGPQPIDGVGNMPPIMSRWYGSPAQIGFETRRDAERYYDTRYGHMKSWSAGFRQSVVARELQAERIFERKMEMEEGFADAIARRFGWQTT